MVFERGVKTNLIILRERQSRFMVAIKNFNKTASGTALAIISTIKKLKPHIKLITFDQSSEFQKYSWIKDYLSAEIYCCQLVSP